MNDWFAWNGTSCKDYGMVCLTQPQILRPSERVSQVSIPGRSGALTYFEGPNVFDNINLSCSCIIDNIDNIPKIAAWLRGKGTLSCPSRPGGFYRGVIANQISFEKAVQGNPHRIFSVQFVCEPFFYLDSGETAVTISSSPYNLRTYGNIPSEPKIKITGSGNGSLMIGNSTILVNSISDLSNGIIVDCSAKIAYTEDSYGNKTLMNTRVSGDWATLPVDPNSSSYTVMIQKEIGLSSVVITPRWRCI